MLNAVLSIVDLNLGGRLALNVAGNSDITLTTTQERNTYILCTGVLTGNISIVFTATNGGFYLIDNRSTGAFTITAKPSGGTGVVIPQNSTCIVMIDPTNTRAVLISTPQQMTTRGDMLYRDANGAQRLAVGAQGSVLYANATDPVWLGPGTAGQLLGSNGAAADPSWVAPYGVGGITLITSGTISSVATLDIVLTAYSNYHGFKFVLSKFLPVTDGVDFQMRFSTDGGSSYDAGAGAYGYDFYSAGTSITGLTGTALLLTSPAKVGNASNEGINAEITMLSQTSSTLNTRVTFATALMDNGGTSIIRTSVGAGARMTAQDTDAVRFMFSSGNIASGRYALYGLTG